MPSLKYDIRIFCENPENNFKYQKKIVLTIKAAHIKYHYVNK